MNYKDYRNRNNKYLYLTDTEQYPINYIKYGYKGYIHVLYSELEDKFFINEINIQNKNELKNIFNETNFSEMYYFFPEETHEVIKEFEIDRLMKEKEKINKLINHYDRREFNEEIDKKIDNIKNDIVKKQDENLYLSL